MALSSVQKKEIAKLLEQAITKKLAKYARESKSMPFLSLLMQNDEQVAAYSFIHSLATTLGMSIYEQFSTIIAKPHSQEVGKTVKMGGTVSPARHAIIGDIVRELREGKRSSSIQKEIQQVLAASVKGGKTSKTNNVADFYMKRSGIEYYFEIKTVKPNIDVFAASKVKLLEWVARKNKTIVPILAFPYNPYAPKPYTRFTMQNVMSSKKDFLVGKEYWDFLGGKGTYRDLLQLVGIAGEKYKTAIQSKIRSIAQTKVGKV